jgi:hypothetical protein
MFLHCRSWNTLGTPGYLPVSRRRHDVTDVIGADGDESDENQMYCADSACRRASPELSSVTCGGGMIVLSRTTYQDASGLMFENNETSPSA